MFVANKRHIFFWILIVGIYLAAWYIQEHLFMNWDVSQLIRATRLMLAGGSYSNDFFTPNTPMILFLYIPPVIFSEITGMKIMLPFSIYIFIINSMSFAICYSLATRIFSDKDHLVADIFLLTLAGVMLITPFFQFGQRDCLFMSMVMPYLLVVALRLQGGVIHTKMAILTGLLAGVGLAIKPQFLVIPAVVECYYIFCTRSWAWARIEVGMIAVLFALYAIILLGYFPDFIFDVMPYMLQNYYSNISIPFKILLLNPMALFCWLPIPIYLATYKKNPYKNLSTVLVLALSGFIISFYMQHSLYLYHIIPPFSIAILLMVFLFTIFIFNNPDKYDYFKMMLAGLIFLLFLKINASEIWIIFIFYPDLFYGFVAVFFSGLFYFAQDTKNLFMILCIVSAIILTGKYCAFMSSHTSLYPYSFLITIVTLILLFSLAVPKTNKSLKEHIVIAVLGLIIFSYPVYVMKNIYNFGLSYKETVLDKLVSFMRTQPSHQSIYVISKRAYYNAPLMDYADVKSVDRFDCLWMIPDLSKRIQADRNSARQYIRSNNSKRFFINMIAEDLHNHKPDLIFVDMKKYDAIVSDDVNSVNILGYFMENQEFSNEWHKYSYLTTITEGESLSFRIYKRT